MHTIYILTLATFVICELKSYLLTYIYTNQAA